MVGEKFLSKELRSAATLIDSKEYFPFFEQFDEHILGKIATRSRSIGARLETVVGHVTETKARVDTAAAGALKTGMETEFAALLKEVQQAQADWVDMAPQMETGEEWIRHRRAAFCAITVIYWQQAQFFGCPNPGSLDAVLLSDTYGVLEEARRAWNGLAENLEG